MRRCVTILAALLTACASPSRPELPERPLEAEVSGCSAVLRGSVCELGADRTLRVVLNVSPPDQVDFTTDRGEPRRSGVAELAGARRFTLRIPAEATRLSVHVRSYTWQGCFTRLLAADATPAWFRHAEARRKAGDSAAAEAEVAAHLAAAGAEGGFAHGVTGRIAMRRGAPTEGEAHLRKAMALHLAAGRLSDAARDGFALAHFLTQDLRLDEALVMVARASEAYGREPEGAMQAALYRAKVQFELGDLEAVLREAQESERLAARLGDAVHARSALWMRAMALAALGDVPLAEASFRALEQRASPPLSACERLSLLASLGFSRNALGAALFDADARRAQAETTLALLADAERLGEGPCPDRRLFLSTLHELAHASLLAGRLERADRLLAQSRADPVQQKQPTLALALRFLDGKLALERGAPAEALAAFRELEQRAQGQRWLETRVRALAFQGSALVRLGRGAQALDVYERLERELDALTERAPLGSTRAGVATALAHFSALHVAALLSHGQAAPALELVLRARSRRARLLADRARLTALAPTERARWDEAVAALRRTQLQSDRLEAEAWQLDVGARDALAEQRAQLERASLASAAAALRALDAPRAEPVTALGANELLLTSFRSTDGWVGFAQSAAGVRARRLEAAGSASAWLAAFDDELDHAHRLYVVMPEELESEDVHALLRNGQPLVATHELAYSLGRPHAPLVRLGGGASALVVADPHGNLPSAREEAAVLERSLAEAGLGVQLVTSHAATRARVAGALPGLALFHFAGHTHFDAQQPWRLGLALSEDGRLALTDILALESAPHLVVLTACDGARASAGLALASTFLAAGAELAIAPARPVDDALSAEFSRLLYRRLLAGADPVSALQATQNELRAAGRSDWAAYRALVP